MRRPGLRGFTLIEMLGVMLVMAMLLTVALDFYIDLSRQATRATELTRGVRRAHAILDRVATDLEHALLVDKPDQVDPINHPWLFLAEPLYADEGSDRLKFVRRSTPRADELPGSDLTIVAYTLRPSEEVEGAYALHRWSLPDLPTALDADFPLEGDPDDLLLADGLHTFRLAFLDRSSGQWTTRWDSSQLADSSSLPLAVEIEVGVHDEIEPDPDAFLADEPRTYVRRVRLPMPVIDLEALLDEEQAEDGDGEDGEGEEDEFADLTGAECISRDEFVALATARGVPAAEADLLYQQLAPQPWSAIKSQFPDAPAFASCQ